jgi:membrane protein required for colicin V production
MIGPLTYLDVALLAVAALSGLLAMYRGFTREVLSIVSWLVAAGALLYFVLYHKAEAEALAKQIGAPLPVGQIVGGAVVFLIVLIVVHLITGKVSDTIQDSRIGMIDRILGLGFGLVRGFVIVMIPYMFYEQFVPNERDQLPWVKEAVSRPYLKSAGDSVRTVLVRVLPSKGAEPAEEPQQRG